MPQYPGLGRLLVGDLGRPLRPTPAPMSQAPGQHLFVEEAIAGQGDDDEAGVATLGNGNADEIAVAVEPEVGVLVAEGRVGHLRLIPAVLPIHQAADRPGGTGARDLIVLEEEARQPIKVTGGFAVIAVGGVHGLIVADLTGGRPRF